MSTFIEEVNIKYGMMPDPELTMMAHFGVLLHRINSISWAILYVADTVSVEIL